MKSKIETSLQYKLSKSLNAEVKVLRDYEIEDICYMLFKNLQMDNSSVSGLRLTSLGYKLLSARYEVYKFPLGETGLHKRLLLRLHTKMRWPYFIDKKFLYLFSGDDAMWLKLSDSDVDRFAEGLD